MVIDYKNYSKGYKLRHRERHWGRYILPFLIIGLVFGGLYLWVGRQLAQGWHYAMQDKAEEARARFLLARKFYLRNHEAEDGLGVVELMCNNMTAARDHLLRGGSSAFDPPAVIAFFTARGQYLQAAQYGEYAVGWDSRPAVKLEQAVALIGIQKLAEAD